MWEKRWATIEQEMLPSRYKQQSKYNNWALAIFQVIFELNNPQMWYHENEEQFIIDYLSHESMRLPL